MPYPIIGLLVGMALGLWMFSERIDGDAFRAEAIDRGFALYCPVDGRFVWRGECEKEPNQ